MCNEEVKEYINLQTGEKLDWDRVQGLPDNAMLRVRPELWVEWDFEKNNELGLDIYKVTKGNSSIKIWWTCLQGHPSYDSYTYSRVRLKTSCPYCSGNRVLKGYNDLWTTNPELAELLLNPEDGYKYGKGSHKKVDWKCPKCCITVKNKQIANVNNQGLSCPNCSDGISFGEKFMYNLLMENKVNFIYNNILEWSENRRYDFYIPKYKLIIETNGEQHSKEKFGNFKNGRTLKEEQENDRFKKELAFKNGIIHYIEIDTTKRSYQVIIDQIENSIMSNLLRNKNYENIIKKCEKSLVEVACELWNSGIHSRLDISKIMKVSDITIYNYLKKGESIGWVDYSLELSKKYTAKKNMKRIVQLDIENNYVKTWKSMKEASEFYNINPISISSVCRGITKSTVGYRWIYEDEYNNISLEEINKKFNKSHFKRKIVQLDNNLNFIKHFEKIKDAATELSLNNARITECCQGKRKTAGGYKWMYLEDYEKQFGKIHNDQNELHKEVI